MATTANVAPITVPCTAASELYAARATIMEPAGDARREAEVVPSLEEVGRTAAVWSSGVATIDEEAGGTVGEMDTTGTVLIDWTNVAVVDVGTVCKGERGGWGWIVWHARSAPLMDLQSATEMQQ